MATFKSDQRTKLTTKPIVRLNSTDENKKHTKLFEFTVPVGNAAINDLVELVVIPKGARIVGGSIKSEAMSSGAGDASMQIGDGTTATKYLGTTSVDAIANFDFANTLALNYGEIVATEFTLTAKVITEAWLAGKKFKGEVSFLMGC